MINYDPDLNAFIGKWESGDPIPQIMWHVTDICPLDCPFCFAHKTTLSVDETRIEALCDFLAKINVLKIDIAGGEPLTYRYLPKVIKNLLERNIFQTITTSGVGTEANKAFIVNNHSTFSRIIMSLDAPTLEGHNSIRNSKAAWQMLMGLLNRLPLMVRAKKVRINTVVTRAFVSSNWTLPMANKIQELGIREWCLIQPHPANAQIEFYQHQISDEEFLKVVSEAKRILGESLVVISRPISMYSTYWVLYPDSILSKHTNSTQDDININLTNASLSVVFEKIKMHDFVLPK